MSLVAPDTLPLLVTGLAMAGLAVWLLWLDAHNLANRLFAGFLLVRGATFVVPALAKALEGGDPAAGIAATYGFWHQVTPPLAIPLVPLTLYFASVHPRRRRIIGSRAAGWVWAAIVIAALTWYIVDPTAYWTAADVPDRPNTAGAGFTAIAYGPLSLFSALRLPAMALAAVLLARHYVQAPAGSSGYSTFLMFAGFAWNALFDAVDIAGNVGVQSAMGDALFIDGYAVAFFLVPLLTAPLIVAALLTILGARRYESTDSTLQETRRFLLFAAPIPVVLAVASHMAQVTDWLGGNNLFIIGLTRLMLPFLVTYALLRYSLFDMDLKMKAGVRRGIMIGGFAVVFVLVSESAESLVLEGQGVWFGVGATVVLALFSQPLQALAERAADRIMPDTLSIDEMSGAQKRAFYCDQFRLVEHDGVVTPKERAMLDRLAGRLGLSAQAAATLEEEPVVAVITRATPGKASKPASRRARVVAVQGTIVGLLALILLGLIGTILEQYIPFSDFGIAVIMAGAIGLALDPAQKLATRWFEEPEPILPENVDLYRAALDVTLEDERLSRRERSYLKGLAENLGLPPPVRRAVDCQQLASRGLPVPWRLRLRAARATP